MSLFGFGGKCEICGCTEDNPCYNPEHGFCGWADDERTICNTAQPFCYTHSLRNR